MNVPGDAAIKPQGTAILLIKCTACGEKYAKKYVGGEEAREKGEAKRGRRGRSGHVTY